jgi:hypothetical protein
LIGEYVFVHFRRRLLLALKDLAILILISEFQNEMLTAGQIGMNVVDYILMRCRSLPTFRRQHNRPLKM